MGWIEYRDPIVLYKDGKSSLDYGIKVYKSNIHSAPSKKLEFIEVEGRDGALTVDKGYEDFILELECALVNENEEIENMAQLSRRAKKFLLEGTNCKLMTSEDTDFYLIGTYCSNVNIDEAIENFGLFNAQFRCKPYRFSVLPREIEITQQNTVIKNFGYKTRPNIAIIGTGDITININSQQVILKSLEGITELEGDKMNAIKIEYLADVPIVKNANNLMYSDFPYLEEGDNSISWELGAGASLEKIIIQYRTAVI